VTGLVVGRCSTWGRRSDVALSRDGDKGRGSAGPTTAVLAWERRWREASTADGPCTPPDVEWRRSSAANDATGCWGGITSGSMAGGVRQGGGSAADDGV
jgi:hypothetical protein